LNLRPSGYEPDELPDCSTPQQRARIVRGTRMEFKEDSVLRKKIRVRAEKITDRGRSGAPAAIL
jgi:hypothetical protein